MIIIIVIIIIVIIVVWYTLLHLSWMALFMIYNNHSYHYQEFWCYQHDDDYGVDNKVTFNHIWEYTKAEKYIIV